MELRALNCLKWGILFLFLNVHIGRLNLLPDFVGALLLHASIQMQAERTQAQERLKPLLLLLAADSFLHWAWQFENGLEALLMLAIYLYVLYVYLGEVAGRIRPEQPERAGQLEGIRISAVLLQMAVYLLSPYGIQGLNALLTVSTLGVCAALLVTVCRIRPLGREG